MRLLPTFGGLLLALQIVAAVHSEQLQQPRFVKVKRTVAQHDHGSSNNLLNSGLQRRAEEAGKLASLLLGPVY